MANQLELIQYFIKEHSLYEDRQRFLASKSNLAKLLHKINPEYNDLNKCKTERELQYFIANFLTELGLECYLEFPLPSGKIDILVPNVRLGIELKIEPYRDDRYLLLAQREKYENDLGWQVVIVSKAGTIGMSVNRFLSQITKRHFIVRRVFI